MSRAQDSRLRQLFVSRITFFSLLRAWVIGRWVQTIWHFDPISPSAQRLLRVFRRFRLIHAEVRHIDCHIGQVKNDVGESEYFKSVSCVQAVCSQIKREHFANNVLIKMMRSEWATSKIVLYFVQLVEKEVMDECLCVDMVEWFLRTELDIASTQCALLIERKQWFSYVERYAQSRGIRLVAYGRLWDIGKIVNAGFRLLRASSKALQVLLAAIRNRLRRSQARTSSEDLPGEPRARGQLPAWRIAIPSWYRMLSLDPTKRSDFFWLHGSGIPYSEVLLYDYVSDRPLDDETLHVINARGLKLLGRAPGVPAWRPTWHMYSVLARTVWKLTWSVLACWARRQWASLYYIHGLLMLAKDYAYWYDFFAANRVKVNVVPTVHSSVGRVLALDALNGVSAAYQYSIIFFPTTLLSAGENVQFVFSPFLEEWLWRTMEAPVDNVVHTGFIYDYAIHGVRASGRVIKMRKQLQNNGARFILCFFDQNSSDRWYTLLSHENAIHDYEYLLQWLLADPTLGIVFKPKRPANLFERIAPVRDLVKECERTGRCRFLTSDTSFYGSVFPTEVALVSDVCIGKLLGGTAALEARLAGVRTVLVDTEGVRNHPIHAWGRGRVVFDDWQSLRTAIDEYRTAPESHLDLGDWSPGLNDFDPFLDGEATLRMALYIRWVYEALKEGASKQEALASATTRFQERWGGARITPTNYCTVP